MKYENLAADFVKYIWMTKYAGTPEGIVSEIKMFAEMYKIDEEKLQDKLAAAKNQ